MEGKSVDLGGRRISKKKKKRREKGGIENVCKMEDNVRIGHKAMTKKIKENRSDLSSKSVDALQRRHRYTECT